jgi:hypothetical protein
VDFRRVSSDIEVPSRWEIRRSSLRLFSKKPIHRVVRRVGCDAIATCLLFVARMVEWLTLCDSLARTYYYSLDYGISSLAFLVVVPVEKIRSWREDA